MSDTPTYSNPPVVEFVLGVQFSPLEKLASGHYGLLWKALGEGWEKPKDASSIQDQFETFDSPKWSHRKGPLLEIKNRMPIGRFILHRGQDRLLQVQPSRFHLNWRTSGDLKPSYKALINEFEKTLEQFTRFVQENDLGSLELNQWEITYIDSFPQGDYWQTPEDWSQFLPGLFGKLFSEADLALEDRSAQWSFEIKEKRGRLHIAAQVGRWRDQERESLLVNTTARGPIRDGAKGSLRDALDLGHLVSVRSFLQMTSEEVRRRWGLKG